MSAPMMNASPDTNAVKAPGHLGNVLTTSCTSVKMALKPSRITPMAPMPSAPSPALFQSLWEPSSVFDHWQLPEPRSSRSVEGQLLPSVAEFRIVHYTTADTRRQEEAADVETDTAAANSRKMQQQSKQRKRTPDNGQRRHKHAHR